jgi:hypothetical protein
LIAEFGKSIVFVANQLGLYAKAIKIKLLLLIFFPFYMDKRYLLHGLISCKNYMVSKVDIKS